MKFLVDANLGREFTSLVNKAGYDGVFINDLRQNASDEDILYIAENEGRVVITNDKDFGELIFKSNRPTRGIILLRTLATEPVERFELMKDILDKAEGKFIVVEEGRIRIREL